MKERTLNRIGWIDIAKFFGIFFVVWGHAYDVLSIFQQFLYLFHVPLFFFISGLTFKPKSDQKKFILNKVKRLYIPYLFAALVTIVIYLLMGTLLHSTENFTIPNLLNCLYGMIYANVSAGNMMWNRPLWFLPTLLVALITFNFIWNIKNKKIKYICLTILICLGYFLSARSVYLPFQIETAFSMLIWIYLGFICKDGLIKIENTNKLTLSIFTIFLLIVGLGVGSYNGTISVMVDLYGKNVLSYLIAAFCLILATILVCIMIHKNLFLEKIGQNTLVILLWHKLPIEFFQQVCPVIKDFMVSPNFFIINTTTFIVSWISIFMCLILKVIYDKFYNHFLLKL